MIECGKVVATIKRPHTWWGGCAPSMWAGISPSPTTSQSPSLSWPATSDMETMASDSEAAAVVVDGG